MQLFRLCLYLTLLATATIRLSAESLPQFRPALIGNHRKSLVNLIDTHKLMERGQKNGTVMFETGITEHGQGFNSRCYRSSPNTELLQKELLGRIDQAQFEPGVYNHTHVTVYLQGTVMFLIHDGKPMLRIFLNQEDDELKAGRDFIAPQFAWAAGNRAFKDWALPLLPGGVSVLGLDIDASGRVKGKKVVYEYPPETRHGQIMLTHIENALFIPAFRNGKPVAAHFNWTTIFTGGGKRSKTG